MSLGIIYSFIFEVLFMLMLFSIQFKLVNCHSTFVSHRMVRYHSLSMSSFEAAKSGAVNTSFLLVLVSYFFMGIICY